MSITNTLADVQQEGGQDDDIAPAGQQNGDVLPLATTSAEIQAIRQVKLSAFWHSQPALWFVQAEAQFHAYNVRGDQSKYFAIIGALDNVVLQGIADVIINPLPQVGRYELLKKSIIERFADSEEKQLRKVLTEVELGDKTPSQLLREMKLLAANKISDNVLRTLWLQRLPSTVQMVLATADSLAIEKMATTADKIAEVSAQSSCYPTMSAISVQEQPVLQTTPLPTSSVAGIAFSPSNAALSDVTSTLLSTVTSLQQQVAELTKMMAQLSHRDNQQSYFKRNRSRSRSQTGPRFRQDGFCYYHSKFGNGAHKCTKPCAFVTSAEN